MKNYYDSQSDVQDLEQQLKRQNELLEDQTILTNVFRKKSQVADNNDQVQKEISSLSFRLFEQKKATQDVN